MEEQLKTQKSLSICVNHLTFLHNIIRQNHPVYVMQGGPLKVSPTFLLARLKGQICVGRQHLSVRRPSRGHISKTKQGPTYRPYCGTPWKLAPRILLQHCSIHAPESRRSGDLVSNKNKINKIKSARILIWPPVRLNVRPHYCCQHTADVSGCQQSATV